MVRYHTVEGAFIPRTATIPDLASTIEVDAVEIGDEATLIIDENSDRTSLSIFNNGAETVYVGGSGVTTATGMPIPPNAEREILSSAAIYGVSTVAGQNARYWEESNT